MTINCIDKGDGTGELMSGIVQPAIAADGTPGPVNTSVATYDAEYDLSTVWTSLGTGLTSAEVAAVISALGAGSYSVRIRATYAGLAGLWNYATASVTASGLIWSFNPDNEPDYSAGTGVFQLFKADNPTGFTPAAFDSISSHTLGAVPNVQITSAYGGVNGTTKAVVMQRTAYSGSWNSDAELGHEIPGGADQLYVEFWIQFGTTAHPWSMGNAYRRQQKVFRIASAYSPNPTVTGDYFSELGIGVIWKLDEDPTYGVRDPLFFHGSPSLGMNNPPLAVTPYNWNSGTGQTTADYNYTNAPTDLNNDGTVDNNPALVNQLGGTIPTTGYVWADAVFGSGVAHKVAFFVKNSSGVGAQDGQLFQWLDDKLIFKNTTIPWKQSYSGTLSAPVTSSGTVLTLASGEGANFANLYANGQITLRISDGVNSEDVTVTKSGTNPSANQVAVIRAATSYAFSVGSTVTIISNTANFNSVRLGGNSNWIGEFPDGTGTNTADWTQQPYLFGRVNIYNAIPTGLPTAGNV